MQFILFMPSQALIHRGILKALNSKEDGGQSLQQRRAMKWVLDNEEYERTNIYMREIILIWKSSAKKSVECSETMYHRVDLGSSEESQTPGHNLNTVS